jgi:hypothetical protein
MAQIDTYEELLKGFGFRPVRARNGGLTFFFDGHSYTLNLYDDDAAFFHLVRWSIWKIETPEDLHEALAICNQLTATRKVVKVAVDQDRAYVSASIELFVAEPAAVKAILLRALNALELAASDLRERMARAGEDRTAAQLRSLVRRRLFDVLANGESQGVKMLFTEDYECVDPATPPGGWPAGPVAAVACASAYRGALAAIRVTIHKQHVAGLVVTTRWSLTGRHTGPFLDLPPCRQEVTLEAVSIDEFRGPQIAYTFTTFDSGPLARNLIAAATQAPAALNTDSVR